MSRHLKGNAHCRCSSGYNIDKYPQDNLVVPMVSLRELNTQIAEQTNSVLERIRTQVWATSSFSIQFS